MLLKAGKIMNEECSECYDKFFAEAWRDFITEYCQKHPEFPSHFTQYHKDNKTEFARKLGLVKEEKI